MLREDGKIQSAWFHAEEILMPPDAEILLVDLLWPLWSGSASGNITESL
jgi:hypothetical protein